MAAKPAATLPVIPAHPDPAKSLKDLDTASAKNERAYLARRSAIQEQVLNVLLTGNERSVGPDGSGGDGGEASFTYLTPVDKLEMGVLEETYKAERLVGNTRVTGDLMQGLREMYRTTIKAMAEDLARSNLDENVKILSKRIEETRAYAADLERSASALRQGLMGEIERFLTGLKIAFDQLGYSSHPLTEYKGGAALGNDPGRLLLFLANTFSEIQTIVSQFKDTQITLQRATQENEQRLRVINELNSKITELSNQNTKLDADLKTWTADATAAKLDATTCRAEKDVLARGLEVLTAEKDARDRALAERTAENEQLRQELMNLTRGEKRTSDPTQGEPTETSKRARDESAQLIAARNENERLKAELAGERQRISQLEAAVAGLREQVQTLTAANTTLSAQLAAIEASLGESMQMRAALETELTEATEKNKACLAEKEMLRAEAEAYQKRLAELTGNVSELSAQLVDEKKRTADEAKRADTAEGREREKYNKMAQELAASRAMVASLEQQVASFSQQAAKAEKRTGPRDPKAARSGGPKTLASPKGAPPASPKGAPPESPKGAPPAPIPEGSTADPPSTPHRKRTRARTDDTVGEARKGPGEDPGEDPESSAGGTKAPKPSNAGIGESEGEEASPVASESEQDDGETLVLP